MQAPKNKQDFYRRYTMGEFGNRIGDWAYEEFLTNGYDGLVGLRFLQAGRPTIYNLTADHVRNHWDFPFSPQEVRVAEQLEQQERRVIINAECCITDTGRLALRYSRLPSKMKPAVPKYGIDVEGILAWEVIRHACNPTSVDDLRELIFTYPNAAIEFTACDRNVGVLPHRNTIIWEVREY